MATTNNTDKQLEQRLLAQLLAQPDATATVKACGSFLRGDDFSDSQHGRVWSLLQRMVDDGDAVNLVNFHARATASGLPVNIAEYIAVQWEGDAALVALTLHELAAKRRLSGALAEALMTLDDPQKRAADAVADITAACEEVNNTSRRKMTPWDELYKTIIKNIERRANGQLPQGVATGYDIIDREGGLEEGALTIVAGRTSNGKTAFALNVALNVARAGVPVVIFSLEMTNDQLGARLLANMSGVDQRSIKAAALTDEQWGKLVTADDRLPLYFSDDRANDRGSIFEAIRNAVDSLGARVVFIDYLQLVKGAGKDRRLDVSAIANDLKVLAVQLNITIVLLSQLTREAQGTTPVPKLNQLKESGEIENAADAVYFVYRPEQHSATLAYPDMSCEWSRYSTHGTALLMCAKNRNGRTGEQLLNFDADTARFSQADSFPAATHTSQTFNAF